MDMMLERNPYLFASMFDKEMLQFETPGTFDFFVAAVIEGYKETLNGSCENMMENTPATKSRIGSVYGRHTDEGALRNAARGMP